MTARERIVEYLRGLGGVRATTRQIAQTLMLPEPSVRRELGELEARRGVVPSFENGDPRTYWSVIVVS